MLMRRVIACLDVDGGRVVKGTRFVDLQTHGLPSELAARYERAGADEITFLDIAASHAGRETVLAEVSRAADVLSVPLTVGGGIRTLQDASSVLRAGADKVALNTAAVARPDLISEIAHRFGSQSVVLSIDARACDSGWRVSTHGGRHDTQLDVLDWAARGEALGAGELLLTSVDRDGTAQGYDVNLTRAVVEGTRVPVIASGGAGSTEHVVAALAAGADAVLLAGTLHRGELRIAAIKQAMARSGFPVRRILETADA